MKGLSTLIGIMALVFVSTSVVRGQSSSRVAPAIVAGLEQSERRTSQLICGLSLYFSADASERVYTLNQKTGVKETRLDGRGLLRCRNDQGFTAEYAILADLDVGLPPQVSGVVPQFSLAAESSAFVVPREVPQIEDTYAAREEFSAVLTSRLSGGQGNLDAKTSALFRGGKHDVVLDVAFISRGQGLEGLRALSLNLRFDDSAPDLF